MTNKSLGLVTAAAVLLSSSAAFAVPVTLVVDGMRSGSGSHYTKSVTGSPTWDWDATTGILTQTGSMSSKYSVGPSPVLTDNVTGMVINTTANTTTATSYSCTEGTFLGGVGANGCLNLNLGADFALNSSAVYNVGGDANCINVTIGGDDVSGGPVRGLGTGSSAAGCATQAGGYNDWFVQVDNIAVGGTLRLWNGVGNVDCMFSTTKNAACGNQTYMVFASTIPVPAGVWLFGSAIGVMTWLRRKVAS